MNPLNKIFRFYKIAKNNYRDTKYSKISIFLDLIKVKLKYGAGYLEYMLFDFLNHREHSYRDEFFTARQWKKMLEEVNPKNPRLDIDNKYESYKAFKEYYKRDILNINQASDRELEDFFIKNEKFFIKKSVSCGGYDVKKIGRDEFDKYRARGFDLIEEPIIQHKDINSISPYAVSTMRFTVLKNEDKIHLLKVAMRFGVNDKEVDNLSSGGGVLRVNEDGSLSDYGYSEPSENNNYKIVKLHIHPKTKFEFKKLRVPYFKEALELVKEMSLKLDEYGYFGWDIAITDKGPVVVEINPRPGFDLLQYYDFVQGNAGIRREIESFFNRGFRWEKNFYL